MMMMISVVVLAVIIYLEVPLYSISTLTPPRLEKRDDREKIVFPKILPAAPKRENIFWGSEMFTSGKEL